MRRIKPTFFAVAVTLATLVPAASASAGLALPNHNETLLPDA
jgi:hypothetical protein